MPHINLLLKQLGYKVSRKVIEHRLYTKRYKFGDDYADVSLEIDDESFSILPCARVHTLFTSNDNVSKPHLTDEMRLCYVDAETITWNPLNIGGTLSMVDSMINKTLQAYIFNHNENEYQNAYQGDFVNYWDADFNAYLVSDDDVLYAAQLRDKDDLSKSDYLAPSYLIFGDDFDTNRFASVRNQKLGEKRDVIKVSIDNGFVPQDQLWPPNSLSAVLDWLKACSNRHYTQVLRSIIEKLRDKKSLLYVLIDTPDGALAIRLDYQIGTHLNVFTNFRKESNKKTKKVKKFSTKHLRLLLCSKMHLTSFNRVSVKYASNQYVLSRNTPNESEPLNKRAIHLIGCGTIGGYLAHQLVQIGAGSFGGTLHLYDMDRFEPENLNRHYLGSKHLGKLKSRALAEQLLEDSLHDIEVQHHTRLNVHELPRFNARDIVIDATGHQPFSFSLSSNIRKIKKHKRPILIHGWVDAYGKAARALVDLGQACYGCIKPVPSEVEIVSERFRLLPDSKIPQEPFNRKCGATYTPYSSMISITAASLVMNGVQSVLNQSKQNFYQTAFDQDIPPLKSDPVKALKQCLLCGGV